MPANAFSARHFVGQSQAGRLRSAFSATIVQWKTKLQTRLTIGVRVVIITYKIP
jgi:hypothetical protein